MAGALQKVAVGCIVLWSAEMIRFENYLIVSSRVHNFRGTSKIMNSWYHEFSDVFYITFNQYILFCNP